MDERLLALPGLAEVRLRHCLDPRVRRWCSYEFFCSAIDRAWFMRNELADYLSHVGIPQGTRLARPELAIIRASLGSPRRLSLSYLRQASSCSSLAVPACCDSLIQQCPNSCQKGPAGWTHFMCPLTHPWQPGTAHGLSCGCRSALSWRPGARRCAPSTLS